MNNLHALRTINDYVCSGRITAEQGAWLYELRRELAWRRLPRWVRVLKWTGVILRSLIFGIHS